MYTNIGKLLTSNIRNSDLYNFVVRLTVLVTEFLGDNTVIAPYIEAISHAVDEMEKVFSRNLKNPLTVKVNSKNKERVNLLTALRREIGVAQKITANTVKVEAADNLKQEMKDRGWWKCTQLSYADATVIIRPMLEKMTELPFSKWVPDAQLQTILDNLKTSQEEFEVLVNNRIEEKSNDTTPQMKVARKKLIDVVLSMLDAIDFGINSDPQTFAEIGGYISEMIVEVNAKTLMRQTLAKNGEEEPDGEDTNTGAEEVTETESEAEADDVSGAPAYE